MRNSKFTFILRLWLLQNLLEIFFYILLDIFHINGLEPIWQNRSIEEIISSVLGIVGLKSIIILIPYLILSYLIHFVFSRKLHKSLRYEMVNFIVNVTLIFLFALMPKNNLEELIWPLIVSVFASIILIFYFFCKLKKRKSSENKIILSRREVP